MVAAGTSQADTVQYENNEQYNTRTMNSTIQRRKTTNGVITMSQNNKEKILVNLEALRKYHQLFIPVS
jgi:hypothetical protein